jgi:hypothetical protein
MSARQNDVLPCFDYTLCCRTVEVFDPQRGSWQALGAQLNSERKYCAAASLGGRLLVLGGMNEARRRCAH